MHRSAAAVLVMGLLDSTRVYRLARAVAVDITVMDTCSRTVTSRYCAKKRITCANLFGTFT